VFQSARRYFRKSGTALTVILAISLGSHAHAEENPRLYTFNIPAEDTARALMDFSRQADVQILFPYEVAAAHSAPALKGQYDRSSALRQLLVGSGLEIARETHGVITLRIAAPNRDKITAISADAPAATKVIVTGSRIRGAKGASPTRIATRGDIEAAGYGQVSDYIKSLPENAGSGRGRSIMSGTGGSTYGSGAETVNLRGLGPDATLTLVNGRRLAADDTTPAPDISIVPLCALERVEIVTDGASALYGSDAVAGVANFILRKDFDGLEASTRQGVSTRGGGAEQDYNLTVGKIWSTGHVLGGIDTYHQDSISAAERDITSQMAVHNSLVDELGKTSAFISAEQSVTDQLSFHADGLYSRRENDKQIQTRPASQPIDAHVNAWSYMLTTGATLDMTRGWTMSADATWSRSEDDEISRYPNLGQQYSYNFDNATAGIELNATGPLLQLPGGPLRAAIGGGYREDTVRYAADFDYGYQGARDIRYAYLEISAPLVTPSETRLGLNALEISVAARAETYSDFGETTNPKLGVRYVPLKGLTLRATAGKSFKAPSFFQTLYPSQMYLLDAFFYGGTTGEVLVSSGGNRDLKPETSKSWTAGFDWSPSGARGLTVSVTYFDIDYANRIVTPISAPGEALSNPIFAPFVISTPTEAQQAALIESAISFDNYSSAPTYDPASVVAYIEDRSVNASRETARGADFNIRKAFQGDFGHIALSAGGTVLNLKRQLIPTVGAETLSGTLFYPARLRGQASVAWTRDAYSASATVNYVSPERDTNSGPDVGIGTWTTLNLNLAYRFGQSSGALSGVDLELSINNALDRAPPRALGAAIQTSGLYFDSANASVVGRYVAVTLRKRM